LFFLLLLLNFFLLLLLLLRLFLLLFQPLGSLLLGFSSLLLDQLGGQSFHVNSFISFIIFRQLITFKVADKAIEALLLQVCIGDPGDSDTTLSMD
jgi:hypothetical protein